MELIDRNGVIFGLYSNPACHYTEAQLAARLSTILCARGLRMMLVYYHQIATVNLLLAVLVYNYY